MGEKTKTRPRYNMWQNSRYMVGLAWKIYKGVLWIALGQAAAQVGVNLLELLVAPAVLDAVERHVPLGELVGLIGLFTLGLMACNGLRSYLNVNTLFGRVHVRLELSSMIHQKFCRTAFPHVEDPTFLALCERADQATNSNQDAAEQIWNTLVELLTNGVSFLLYLSLLTAVDPWILLLTAATAAAGYFGGRPLREWRFRHREEENADSYRVSYTAKRARDPKLAKDIRIFGLGPWIDDVFESAMALLRDFQRRSGLRELGADVLELLLSFLRNAIAYAYLIRLTLAGGLSAAEFLLYFTAVGGFTNWVSGIFAQLSALHKQSLDLSSLREFLEYPEPFRFQAGEPLPVRAGQPCTLELRDVSFRYPGASEDTLSHVDLTIRPGEKLAVVGLNGAGKTTLIKLLCGFYDPTGGQVLLNGEDIRKYDRRDYYKHFSAVFQSFSLLAATVAENVAQTTEGIDMDRVRACIQKADLTEKVESLPRGYESELSRDVYLDGAELSGGELQRLMLARALYKDAPILVLDEPTAALDPIAENDIYQKYNDMTRDRTAIFISHRLASTRFCDRILLIQDGGIAEKGTHEALMAKGGTYARLFAVQSQYYREKGGERHGEE